jgi:hypothetical protein
MIQLLRANTTPTVSLDMLDRIVVAYLLLPLFIFLIGWFQWWASLPLALCTVYSLRYLAAPWRTGATRLPITSLQLSLAIGVGIGWTVLGGGAHILFANADWSIRDAVLHDLVTSEWPVGYGVLNGKESLLRAPVAFYLPAALVGKLAGLKMAHLAMALWTATGATLFLLQALSLVCPRLSTAIIVIVVVVLFSGFDIVGCLLNYGGRFRENWKLAMHLEWWAVDYQYSSMTTQLFWVPNHALGGWLAIGLLARDRSDTPLNAMLPIIFVAVTLWSPLTALGLAPFILWKLARSIRRDRSLYFLQPRQWAPGFVVGLAIAAYLVVDSNGIARGAALGAHGGADGFGALSRQMQFFMLEAGCIGFAVLAIRPSAEVALALIILALLPLVSFGPGNDLVMRASIPSLTILAIGAFIALCSEQPASGKSLKKPILVCMLAVGAVTPIGEFARAAVLRSWPINFQANLITANCGQIPAHYIARLSGEPISHLLRTAHPIPRVARSAESCGNPAIKLMQDGGLL